MIAESVKAEIIDEALKGKPRVEIIKQFRVSASAVTRILRSVDAIDEKRSEAARKNVRCLKGEIFEYRPRARAR